MKQATQLAGFLKSKRTVSKGVRPYLAGFLVVCLLVPAVISGRYVEDALVAAPWAYPLLRPTLTGTWSGTFTLSGGMEFALFFDVRREPLAYGKPKLLAFSGALLSGRASWCDSDGRQAMNLPIGGAVPMLSGYNAAADRIEIDVSTPAHPEPGFLPYIFTGKWKADKLEVAPLFAYWTGSDLEDLSNDPKLVVPPVITLQKASMSSFWATCVSIGSKNNGSYAQGPNLAGRGAAELPQN